MLLIPTMKVSEVMVGGGRVVALCSTPQHRRTHRETPTIPTALIPDPLFLLPACYLLLAGIGCCSGIPQRPVTPQKYWRLSRAPDRERKATNHIMTALAQLKVRRAPFLTLRHAKASLERSQITHAVQEKRSKGVFGRV